MKTAAVIVRASCAAVTERAVFFIFLRTESAITQRRRAGRCAERSWRFRCLKSVHGHLVITVEDWDKKSEERNHAEGGTEPCWGYGIMLGSMEPCCGEHGGNYMRDGVWLTAGIFLFYCAYCDLRWGMISVKSCLIAAGAGIVLRAAGAPETVPVLMEWVAGLIPGVFVMGIAVGSREQIGKGDAWILLALGVLVGAGRCMGLFVTALVLSLPFSAVWHVACHWKKCGRNIFATPVKEEGQTAFPFAPGLLLAYVLWSV